MSSEIINVDYIQEFITMAGKETMQVAVVMYKSSVGEYIENSLEYSSKCEFEDAASELHKIKGASNSVGLIRLAILIQDIEKNLLEKREAYDIKAEIESFENILADDLKVLNKTIDDC